MIAQVSRDLPHLPPFTINNGSSPRSQIQASLSLAIISVPSNFLVYHTPSDLFGTLRASPPPPQPLDFLHSLPTQLRCCDSPLQQPFLNSPTAVFSPPGWCSASALGSTFPVPLSERPWELHSRRGGLHCKPGSPLATDPPHCLPGQLGSLLTSWCPLSATPFLPLPAPNALPSLPMQ